MTQLSSAQAFLQNRLRERESLIGFTDWQIVTLGDGNDPVTVIAHETDKDYGDAILYWVHTSSEGETNRFKVLNYPGSGLTLDNSAAWHRVVICKPFWSSRYWIFAPTDESIYLFKGANPLQMGLQLASMVTPERIFVNGLYLVSGGILGTNGGEYRAGSKYIYVAPSASFVDLFTGTDYRPATAGQSRWVRVGYDRSGGASVLAGDEFDSSETDTLNFLPTAVEPDVYYAAYILLTNGDSDIADENFVAAPDVNAIGEPVFVQASDPGPVGANHIWIDRSNNLLKARNSANTNWVVIGGSGSSSASLTVDALAVQTADATIANSDTETALYGSASGTYTLAADELVVGMAVVTHLAGYVSTTGTPGLTLRVKLGSTEVLSGSVTMPSSVSDIGWQFNAVVTCRGEGDTSTGSVVATGSFTINGVVYPLVATTATAIDTTISNQLTVTAEWQVADASNTITSQTATVEKKYPN